MRTVSLLMCNWCEGDYSWQSVQAVFAKRIDAENEANTQNKNNTYRQAFYYVVDWSVL